ncbi:S-adenosylmethionine decarboxylase, partial [Pseudomonas syringae pv. tagetis]
QDQQAYVEYINSVYDAERLTRILTDLVDIIGANILNNARQDYDPQGASETILISEQPVTPTERDIEESPGPMTDTNQ